MPCAVQPVHQGPDPQGDVAAVAEVPAGVPADDGQPLQAGLDCEHIHCTGPRRVAASRYTNRQQ